MDAYELYRYIFIGGLVLAIIMLIATVLIYFLLDIKNTVNDLSGKNKRRAIENIHNKSKSNGANKRHAAKVNYEAQTTSTRLAMESAQTTKISAQDRYDSMEASETTNLSEQPTSETTVLNAVEPVVENVQPAFKLEEMSFDDPAFSIDVDITYVHANEIVK